MFGVSWRSPECLWGCLWEASGSVWGLCEASLGSWGHLGRLDALKNSQGRPQISPNTTPRGSRWPPRASQRRPQRPPRDHKRPQNTAKMTYQVKTAKTSKMKTISMKNNDFSNKKLTKMGQKRSQNKESRGKRAHHGAKSRRRALSSHPRAPKGAQTKASDDLLYDLLIDFASGGPLGRLCAPGIFDKSIK